MIQFNNNIYKTLNDKFYYGNKQVGYVYYGNKLIYPEKEIEIGGIKIDTSPHPINGNMYDLGIQATSNTRFELCIIPNTTTTNDRFIFGTHHDNWSENMRKRGENGENEGAMSDLTLAPNALGDYPYPNESSFHLIYGGGTIRFRYGGEQKNFDQGDQYNTANSGGDYNLGYSLAKKDVYTICLEKNGSISSAFDYGKYYWEQLKNEGKITENEYQKHINKFTKVGDITKGVTTNVDPPAFTNTSAHLWLNAINRYVTNPNEDRCCTKKEDNEALTYYYPTTNFTFVYLIIYKYSGSEGSVSDKYLFTQRITNEDDGHDRKIVVFDRYDWDYDSKKEFKKTPFKTIYPFSYCEPIS